jgi:hypothetical protein
LARGLGRERRLLAPGGGARAFLETEAASGGGPPSSGERAPCRRPSGRGTRQSSQRRSRYRADLRGPHGGGGTGPARRSSSTDGSGTPGAAPSPSSWSPTPR